MIVWATHPRHLPAVPPVGRVAVVDVAFAAGKEWRSKSLAFAHALGDRLVAWVDHHEHPEAWAHVKNDARYVLVRNREAHACPELVTPELVTGAGKIDVVVAHCDFDGAIAAVKWLRGGKAPWPEADEDARAVDSPGRGHSLSPFGARIAGAMDEASASYSREKLLALMTAIATALTNNDFSPGLDDEIDRLARAAAAAAARDRALAQSHGKLEAPGVFVVRVGKKPDNRSRRNFLLYAEEQAAIGVLHEPDPKGGFWMIAATFQEDINLEHAAGFDGGRSDYRFAHTSHDGADLVADLSRLSQKSTSST